MRANETRSGGAGTILLSIAAVALAGMVGTIGLIHQVAELGPKVGDIVAFDPMERMAQDVHTRVAAIPADDKPGVACVLDVRVMHTGGGSMVVEQREPRPVFGYRVHWSGEHSSNDGADCGGSADLLVNPEDIETLAMAAGGYGVLAHKHPGTSGRAAAAR
ncbi:MAG TPA: hypothetical protein VH855_13815 [Acetobacteraceae bacterium]|jgi:hypothetical protein